MGLPVVVDDERVLSDAEIAEGMLDLHIQPTPQQWVFATTYVSLPLNTRGKLAYDAAGYPSIDHLCRDMQRIRIRQVFASVSVRAILKLLTYRSMIEHQINKDSLVGMTKDVLVKSDNFRDQLSAIRLLADLGGFRR